MARRFVHVPHEFLVPFDGSFRIRKSITLPPKRRRDREENRQALDTAIGRMRKLQARLLASDTRALLVVFQALDAAGKDGTIKAVMSGINPAGCEVYSFKAPNSLELDHDFLWRIAIRLPERGRIGIFNRSHYEEVLVVKVHPEILQAQRLPSLPSAKKVWKERYESIRTFERHVARNGTTIVKFFLHVSRGEQKRRLLDRINDPEAHWKFAEGDLRERELFDEYHDAYQQALRETSRPWAPWYAIPADDKYFMRRTVAEILVETLRGMDLHYPATTREQELSMASAKRALERETRKRKK
jgi:PPK2 family polyphosphate:nucleotide phosphotransferase